MLGLIMEILIFLIGVFNFIRGNLIGIILMSIIIFLWIIGLIWDKIQFKDWFYSWKQLKYLFGFSMKEKGDSNEK